MSTESTNVLTQGSVTLTISLDRPSSLALAHLELWHATTGWRSIRSWPTPGGQLTHTMSLSTTGTWLARARTVALDGTTAYSNEHQVTVHSKVLAVWASDYSPVVNTHVTLTASGIGDRHDQWRMQWQHKIGAGEWTLDADSNPVTWAAWGQVSWRWVEWFGDGTVLVSNEITVSPVAPPPPPPPPDYNVRISDGNQDSLQWGLNHAAATGWPLIVTGHYVVTKTIVIPAGVRIDATNASFSITEADASRFRNAQTGGGGYTGAGWFDWNGGTFDGGGDTIFTISHSPGFTIRNATLYNYARSGNTGHAIEINSSGGPHTPGVYNVNIIGNTFRGVTSQRRSGNDEALSWDFAWTDSGCAEPYDHTMTHNVYIAGNTFHRWDESGAWEFALCALGAHRMGSADYGKTRGSHPLSKPNPANGNPSQRHNGFLIENNHIHCTVCGSDDGAAVSPDKGIMAIWSTRDVVIRNNHFYGGTCRDTYPANKFISAFDETKSLTSADVNISIHGNLHNGVPVSITLPNSNSTGG